ncbi:MAG TPA: KTSC domain-containing protein [Candidatus Thermoplasmatota archaeon]|nr:KTSC domain-containing protein [Candidatus Thermoplasmatota archaeon]
MRPDALPDAWATPARSAAAPPKTDAFTIELPQSKALARLRFEEADKALVVEFRNGTVYRYFGVTRNDYTTLATSASPGARFNQTIQPYHEFERLGDLPPQPWQATQKA